MENSNNDLNGTKRTKETPVLKKETKDKEKCKDVKYKSKKHSDAIINITTKEHLEKILTEAGDKTIIVEFFAPWCGPCRILSLKLKELADLYKDKVIIVKVNVDDFEDIAVEYNVTSMPSFTILKNKKRIHEFHGSKAEELENAFEKYVGKPTGQDDIGANK